MLISGGVDLLAEVIGRAEPIRQRQVLSRLEEIGRLGQVRIEQASASPDGGPSPSRFAELVALGQQPAAWPRTNFNLAVAPDSSRPTEAARDFEKFFLSQFLKAIMPVSGADEKHGSEVLAQDVAHSQMANALADELSKQTGLGIAEQLAAARPEPQQFTGTLLSPVAMTMPASNMAQSAMAGAADKPAEIPVPGADAQPPVAITMQAREPEMAMSPIAAAAGADSTSPFSALLSAVEGFFVSIGGTRPVGDRMRSLR